MRKLFLFFMLFCPMVLSAQTWSTMNVDLAVPSVGSTPGTQLTTAIMNAATSSVNCVPGSSCIWEAIPPAPIPTGELVGANPNSCSNLGPVQVNGSGGTLFPAQSMNGTVVAHSDQNSTSAVWGVVFGSGIRPTSMSAVECITPGIPSITVNNDFTDLMWIQIQSNGKGPLVNLVNGGSSSTCASGFLGAEVEDPANGATSTKVCIHNNPLPWVSGQTYSSGNQVLDGPVLGSSGPVYGIYQNITGTNTTTAPHSDTTNWSYAGPAYSYWLSLFYNSATSSGTLNVYTAQGTLIGTTTKTLTNNGAVGEFRLWSNENQGDAGVSYVSAIMLNWTSPSNPQFWTQTDTWAGILAPSRVPSWTPGVNGGIPTITTQCVTAACNTLVSAGSSATPSQIVSAMQSAPSNTFVSMTSGTYSLGATTITGVAKNVALRGAGAASTGSILNMTGGDPALQVNGGSLGSVVAVSPISGQPGNLIQGQNQAILTNGSSFSITVGNPIVFDEAPTPIDNGGIMVNGATVAYTGPFLAPGNAGPYNEDGTSQGYRGTCQTGTISSCSGLQNEVVFITSCNGLTTPGTVCTGNNITIGFNPPLHMSNWSTIYGMSARWSSTPAMYVGLEDFLINGSGNSGADNIGWNQCYYCWVKGVASIDSSGNGGAPGHVMALFSGFDTIKNSYFFLTQNHITSSYGVNCAGSSGLLIENNIFHAVASPVMYNGPCNDTVVAYNYDINNYYTESTGFSQNFNGEHAGGVDTNLLEGNIANQAQPDLIHGTGNLDTFFRNQLSGPLPACYASGSTYATSTYEQCTNSNPHPQTPFPVGAYHRFYNFVGNILGTTGINTQYSANVTHCTSNCIFETGTDVGFNGFPSTDPNVLATATIWANVDAANGFGNPRFNCPEIGAGTSFTGFPLSQAYLFNPCPSSHTIPASFYYSSTPSWWPSGKPWPLIGPDITSGNLLLCTGGTQARALVTTATVAACTSAGGTAATAYSGLANSNPAMDCYLSLGGLPNGTGPQLTNFSEAACYTTVAQAATPTFSPAAGTYTANQSVTISTTTSGATICWAINTPPTTNGAGTCTSGTTYSGPVTISSTETLEAIATCLSTSACAGFTDSSIGTANYVLQGSVPTFAPGTGTYSSAQTVTISQAQSLNMCVTNNGTAPSSNGLGACSNGVLTTSGSTVVVSTTETLEAVAINSGWTDSSVGIAIYTFTPIASVSPLTLTFGPQAINTVSASQTVTVTNTGGGTLTFSSPLSVTGDFSALTSTCDTNNPLGPSSSCTVAVSSSPCVAGPLFGVVTFFDNSGGIPSQQTVTLIGSGTGQFTGNCSKSFNINVQP